MFLWEQGLAAVCVLMGAGYGFSVCSYGSRVWQLCVFLWEQGLTVLCVLLLHLVAVTYKPKAEAVDIKALLQR